MRAASGACKPLAFAGQPLAPALELARLLVDAAALAASTWICCCTCATSLCCWLLAPCAVRTASS